MRLLPPIENKDEQRGLPRQAAKMGRTLWHQNKWHIKWHKWLVTGYDIYIDRQIMIPTLHARLQMIEYVVEQENLNTNGAFVETDLREDLALMDAPELTRFVQALEANHF